MSERTICISSLKLSPGAKLAQPVRRADGAMLLPAGAEIDADQLQLLIQRGIDHVYVVQDETRDAAQIESDVAAAANRVAHLFRGKGSAAREALAVVIADYRRREAS